MRSLINSKTDKSFSGEVIWIVPKMFTRLLVCSLILEAHRSECHLEVVALSLVICLECEEVARVEGGKKKKTEKSRFVAGCFFGCCL